MIIGPAVIQLHFYPQNASLIPHLLLQEMGERFELILVDRSRNEHLSPEYLSLNPNGLIPVLVDGDLVLYETAAICLYLCDKHPEKHFAPAIGTADRAHFYKWLFWLSNTLQTTLQTYYHAERWVDANNTIAATQVKALAQARITKMLAQIDVHLGQTEAPWFMGDAYTAIDCYVFTLCRWTLGFERGGAKDFANLASYLQRVKSRPATQTVLATERGAI